VTPLTVLTSARPLAGLLFAAGLLTGCAGEPATDRAAPSSPAAATSDPPQESTRETTATECLLVERKGLRLGVTVPAGFSVTTTPQGGGDYAPSQQVNLLAVAQRRNASGELPVVVVVVYGYGPGERSGTDALEASVRNFRQLVGSDDAGGAVAARPTTIAGRRGSAGGAADATAMDFQSPDGKPASLHWWSVPAGQESQGQFVVAMGARDDTSDRRFATAFRNGLKAGGC
jgi:hypothetical protein